MSKNPQVYLYSEPPPELLAEAHMKPVPTSREVDESPFSGYPKERI